MNMYIFTQYIYTINIIFTQYKYHKQYKYHIYDIYIVVCTMRIPLITNLQPTPTYCTLPFTVTTPGL